MTLEATQSRVTIDDYLSFERAADSRHDCVDGVISAVPDSTSEHAAISTNLIGELRIRLNGRGCRPTTSVLRLFVPATAAFFYPDVMVICGGFRSSEHDADSVTNPRVIFEVVTAQTLDRDLGIKFQHYRRLESLEAYVLVHAEERRIEHRQRLDDGGWLIREVTEGDLALPALDIAIPLDEIYDLTDVRPG